MILLRLMRGGEIIAEGVHFADGVCMLRWSDKCTTWYESTAAMASTHGIATDSWPTQRTEKLPLAIIEM